MALCPVIFRSLRLALHRNNHTLHPIQLPGFRLIYSCSFIFFALLMLVAIAAPNILACLL